MIGQTQMEITARTQLQERGVSESEIKDRLLQKGISIEQLSADQALRIQPIIEQIVKGVRSVLRLHLKEPRMSRPNPRLTHSIEK
jgi:hypothetical protein